MSSIRWYYWLTPLFWIVDLLDGPSIRAAALEGHPGWKALYYLFCMAIPVIAHFYPEWTSRLGLVESSANVLLLVLSVVVPYYGFVDRVATGEFPAESPITMEKMANFAVSSIVWFVSFQLLMHREPFHRRGSL